MTSWGGVFCWSLASSSAIRLPRYQGSWWKQKSNQRCPNCRETPRSTQWRLSTGNPLTVLKNGNSSNFNGPFTPFTISCCLNAIIASWFISSWVLRLCPSEPGRYTRACLVLSGSPHQGYSTSCNHRYHWTGEYFGEEPWQHYHISKCKQKLLNRPQHHRAAISCQQIPSSSFR